MLQSTLYNLGKIPLIFLLFLFFISCETDFETNTEWEEITIVYGLLDKSEDIQYIKINKAFLNNGYNAEEIAAIKDSVYHYTDLSVKLIAFDGSDIKYEIYLLSEEKNDKEEGIFHNPEHYLYRTPDAYVPDDAYFYKLIIENTLSGEVIDAKTSVVGDANVVLPRINSRTLRYITDSRIIIEWRPHNNARFYDLAIRLNYEEMPVSDTTDVTLKYTDWTVFSQRLSTNTIQFQAFVEELFYVYNLLIPDNEEVYRRALNVEYRISAGGDELYNYIQVNRPSIGIVQKKPEYSNLNNAYGIFSSRFKQSIEMELAANFIDSLVNGQEMKGKNFVY